MCSVPPLQTSSLELELQALCVGVISLQDLIIIDLVSGSVLSMIDALPSDDRVSEEHYLIHAPEIAASI